MVAPPPSAPPALIQAHVVLPAGVERVRLPARISAGRVIVRLLVAGRALDFQLDSGSSGIVIDRDVAIALRLPAQPSTVQGLAGASDALQVTLPRSTLGGLAIEHAVATAAPFAFQVDASTKVVGLLGYDFIAGCVVAIDYAHGTVDAIAPAAFVAPPSALVLPASLERHIPLVALDVNGARGTRFVLDTGADGMAIFSPFAALHPEALRGAHRTQPAYRTGALDVSGIGGSAAGAQQLVLASAGLAGARFHAVPAMLVQRMLDPAGDLDGLIGTSLLRCFDLYLDYQRSRVLLVADLGARGTQCP